MSENIQFEYGNNVGPDVNINYQSCKLSTVSTQKSSPQPSKSKCLQLRFLKSNRMPDVVYTGLPIGGEDASIEVALVDGHTGNVVKSGSEASAEVEFLVLDIAFNKNDMENWTSEEYIPYIRPGRRGTASLLRRARIRLSEGRGSLSHIFFSHSRYPLPKIEVRLGARVIGEMDSSEGTRIREAISKPFTVKDRRGMHKMHYPVKLTDEVWRLVNIGRNGPIHEKLRKGNITTIEHFLYEYTANRERLKDILGKSMSAKKLVATANHAQTCNTVIEDLVPFEGNDGGVIVDSDHFQMNAPMRSYSPNSFVVSNSEGSDGSMFARFNQPLDIQDRGSTDEHLHHLVTSGSDASAEGEILAPNNKEFDKNGKDNWTFEEFKAHVLQDEHLLFLDPDDPLQSSTLGSPNELQSAVNSSLARSVLPDKAQTRWKMVFSVVRCFSIRRLVARK